MTAGIPRFAGDLPEDVAQVQRVFDFEHRRFERSLLTRFEPTLVPQFLDECGLRRDFFAGKTVLDAGCGSGRWSYALAALGARVTAIDLTAGGIEAAAGALGKGPDASCAQADLLRPPFAADTFDFVMSWGVLHHTADTRAGFARLARLVKPGGTFFVMVYEAQRASVIRGTEVLRSLMRRLPDDRRYDACRRLVIDTDRHPWLYDLLSRYLMVAAHRTGASQEEIDTYQFGLFDAYSPRFNHVHTAEEVVGWFRDHGFTDIAVVDGSAGAVRVRGVRPASGHRPRPTAPVPAGRGEATTWLADLSRARGRPLRILHFGNIANNAYINAKIQRREGIEADVACPDYTHVMGAPEWEDADFEGEVDEMRPDWRSVDLKGFERPAWFAQGSTATCIRYLLALVDQDDRRLARARRRVRADDWVTYRVPALLEKLELPSLPTPHVGPTIDRGRYLAGLAARKTRAAGRATRSVAGGTPPGEALANEVFPTRMARYRTTPDPPPSAPPAAMGIDEVAEEAGSTDAALGVDELHDDLVTRFAGLFPERPDGLAAGDLVAWRHAAQTWAPLLERYDLVQAYGTTPIIPLLAGLPRWTAYEHGTLRAIPFENSPTGRLTALCYREAPAVFVTNADDLDPAQRLGVAAERLTALPHAADTPKLFAFADEHADRLASVDGRVTFFAPARQDWGGGDAGQHKGNDRIVRALRLLLDGGAELRVVFVAWGRSLDETRRLVDELDVGPAVTWAAPMRKSALWRRYLASHAVLDQFVIEAFGGVTFEALGLGRRVITALDGPVHDRFFGVAPPILVAKEVDEIAAAMQSVIDDPGDEAGVGERSRAWVAERHSSERIVELQAMAYRRLLEHVPA